MVFSFTDFKVDLFFSQIVDFFFLTASLSVVNHIPENCQSSGDLTTTYLRRKDVHKAIHASGPFGIYTEIWSICSDKLIYSQSDENMVFLLILLKWVSFH